jgi:tRNA-Thr(GGU) m(6)t(6)A37 methyltransferase TsaA
LCPGKIEIRPIGFVKRTSSGEDIKDRSLVSRIVLRKSLTEALDGIEDFSHVSVIYWMQKMPRNGKAPLKIHPRGESGLPLVGVLATRSPHHPNPVGLTLAEVVKRKENALFVRGLDAYDGTPVLDIKPYGCPWEVVTDFRVPQWFYQNQPTSL